MVPRGRGSGRGRARGRGTPRGQAGPRGRPRTSQTAQQPGPSIPAADPPASPLPPPATTPSRKRPRSAATDTLAQEPPSTHVDSPHRASKRVRRPSYRAASSHVSTPPPPSAADQVTPPTPTTAHRARTRQREEADTDDDDVALVEDAVETDAGLTYFEAHRGTVRTSNLTLASLNILPQDQLNAALKAYKDPLATHIKLKYDELRKQLPNFGLFLDVGHSLLLYGFGSKRAILDEFAQQLSANSPVLVVNGFNPTLSLRAVLSQLAALLKLQDFSKRSIFDYVDAICVGLASARETVSLVIHNIDGPSLRQPESQHALSRLAAVTRLRLAASIDHVNAALLWDAQTYDAFAWLWVRCDTLQPYDVETTFSTKPLLRGSAERRVDGAVALLQSLSERARSVFRELAARQKKGAQNSLQTRPSFNELFEITMRKFLVSDTATLRTILTELSTHDLLQSRRGADSEERLWVPLDDTQLEEVLKKIEQEG